MKPFGEKIKLYIFGSSRGNAVGATVYGMPAGIGIDGVKEEMMRRSPKADYDTGRRETDDVEFLCGVEDGKTDGAPLCLIIKNHDVRHEKPTVLRPGHADYTSFLKYGEISEGGGFFSGRMTAPITAVGALAKEYLREKGIYIKAHIKEIHGVSDTESEMLHEIEKARENGDSVGGIIECEVVGAQSGIGGALWDGIESRISQAIFGIPAVKGIEFGLGFGYSRKYGSEANDGYCLDSGKIKQIGNNCGGILGGITTGESVVFRVAVKPTPSISKAQKSVDVTAMTETVIKSDKRNDACIVPRAVPALEAVTAIVFLDWLV